MLVYVSDTIAEFVWRRLRETTKDPLKESRRLDTNVTPEILHNKYERCSIKWVKGIVYRGDTAGAWA
jgi:hypothetical protein